MVIVVVSRVTVPFANNLPLIEAPAPVVMSAKTITLPNMITPLPIVTEEPTCQ